MLNASKHLRLTTYVGEKVFKVQSLLGKMLVSKHYKTNGGFPVMAETTRNHIFSKEISQVIIAAMVLAPISIEKIVCE